MRCVLIVVAVAVGVVVGGLILHGLNGGDERAAYERCKDALAPWSNPAEEC
jgi:hypothetical protein